MNDADFETVWTTHVDTNTKAQTKRRRRHGSSLSTMRDKGQLSEEQYQAACEIAFAAEMIERSVSVRCASLEARVDSSGSARDALIEKLGAVRFEMAYSQWRSRLPMPRRMVVDMVIESSSLVSIARVYNTPWRRAREMLLRSLDHWPAVKERIWRDVEERDVLWRYARIGCGELR